MKTPEEFIDFYYKEIEGFDRINMLAMLNGYGASIKKEIFSKVKDIILNEELSDGEIIDNIDTEFNLKIRESEEEK